LSQRPAPTLSASDLFERVQLILQQLEKATYYNILAPLGFALRRSLLKIPETALDQQRQPEVASVQAVKALARAVRQQHPTLVTTLQAAAQAEATSLWHRFADDLQETAVLSQLDDIVSRYGYLSEVGTDIAVPTWYENPQPVRDLLIQFLLNPPPEAVTDEDSPGQTGGWRWQQVQQRLNLKGRVAEVYLKLLAELRWSCLALEQAAIAQSLIDQTGDAFFLTYEELKTGLMARQPMQALVAERRSQLAQHQALASVPFVVYGHNPPPSPSASTNIEPLRTGTWQGIGASAGQVQGPVKVLTSVQLSERLAPNTILVVPYTDAGWAPVLAQAAGLVAEVGGSLSHGAIVAREYKIPAVMNLSQATQRFQDGQVIRIDGRAGTVELVDAES
ncbi:MAG: PEP-utilizing enzyme, partial [Cyanobacteria bacterium P01_H01_bin.153]